MAEAAQSIDAFDLVPKRSGLYLFDQAAAARAGVERLPRAKDEICGTRDQSTETPCLPVVAGG